MQSCVLLRINRQLLVDIWLVYKTSHNIKTSLSICRSSYSVYFGDFSIFCNFFTFQALIHVIMTCVNVEHQHYRFSVSISSPSICMAGLGVTTALSAHQLPSARFHLHRSSVCVICDLEEGHGILAATRPLLSSESADCGALCWRTADFSLTVTPANCIIA